MLEVRRVKLSDLKPHHRNPRHHPDPGSDEWNALKKSLDSDFFEPLVVNSGKTHKVLRNVIVSGHLRVKVLMSEGYTHADAVVKDYDEARHVQVMLRANNQTGTWDEKILADLLNGIGKDDLDLTGFDGGEIDRLLAGIGGGKDAPEPQIDKAAELQKKWGTKRGQLWDIGEHRLLCGDCTLKADVETAMQGEKSDAILTDPPYGQDQKGVPGDSPKEMGRIVPAFTALIPATDAVAVMFQSPRTFTVALDAMRLNGWQFNRALWLYKQAQCVKPWRGWLLTSEAILLFSKGEANWNECNPYVHDCYMLSEVSGELGKESGWHGSVKPLVVVRDLAQRISAKDQTIFDPFSGSGTTLVACEQLKRRGRGIEIDPGYCGVILQRLSDMGLKPKLQKA